MRNPIWVICCGGLAIAALLLMPVGCANGTTTAEEESTYKNPDKASLKPPPADAMKPPEGFKSSIESGGPGGPPPNATR